MRWDCLFQRYFIARKGVLMLTDEQKKNLYGICKAHGLNGMTDALAKQKEFLEKPHKTFVIDDKESCFNALFLQYIQYL